MNPLQSDPRKQKVQAYGQYQTYCLVAIAVLGVLGALHHHSADAQYALFSLLFRVGVSVLAVVAIIVLEMKKQALKRAMAAEDAEARRQNPGSTPGVWPPPPL